MKIIFFDTETTGNTPTDYLCQLAVKEINITKPLVNELFKPPAPIPFECSAIHHISNKKVADKPAFQESSHYQEIKNLFEDKNVLSVAHNAPFDVQILANEHVSPANVICTYKVVRELDTERRFAMHKLQYLRYALDIELDVPAHDALADVLVLEQLFAWELAEAQKKWGIDEAAAIEKMIAITKEPITFTQFDFGKHKGKTIAEVAATDPGYLSWLLEQKRQSTQNETDWIYTLEKFVK